MAFLKNIRQLVWQPFYDTALAERVAAEAIEAWQHAWHSPEEAAACVECQTKILEARRDLAVVLEQDHTHLCPVCNKYVPCIDDCTLHVGVLDVRLGGSVICDPCADAFGIEKESW